jgi:hypothetical protein
VRTEVRADTTSVVVCVACGARFDTDGARAGVRVACDLCGTPLVLGALCRDRRRYRVRSPVPPLARRLDRIEIRRFAGRALLVLALAGLMAAAWRWRGPLATWARETRVAILRSGNAR